MRKLIVAQAQRSREPDMTVEGKPSLRRHRRVGRPWSAETQPRHCTIDVDKTQRAPRPHNAATPSVSWVWPKGSPRLSRRHGACVPTNWEGHHNAQTRRRALSHGAPAQDTPKSSDQDLTREPSNWQEEATTTTATARLALETRPHHGRHLQNHGAHQLRRTSVL
jgi:hypothetical protein